MFKNLGIYVAETIKRYHYVNYLYRISSTTSFKVLLSCKSTDINILKNLFLTYISPKLEYNTPIWSPYLKKDVNHTESVQRNYTRLIFNRNFNISYTSYLDRLTNLKTNSLEYRRHEFDLITFFKLVIGETINNIQSIFESYKSNNLLKGND